MALNWPWGRKPVKQEVGAALEEETSPEIEAQLKSAMTIKFLCDVGQMFARDLQEGPEELKADAPAKIDHQLAKVLTLFVTLEDDFARNMAIHQICKLLIAAERFDEAENIFATVKDDFFREKIQQDCPQLTSAGA